MPSAGRAARALPQLAALAAVAPAAPAAAQSLQPAGWDAGLRLAEAVDRNPHPDIVEVDFKARVARVEIAPGVEVDAWTYNGSRFRTASITCRSGWRSRWSPVSGTIPGPTIRVKVGDMCSITPRAAC